MLARCVPAGAAATTTLHALYADGARVDRGRASSCRCEITTRSANSNRISSSTGSWCSPTGPKTDAADSLARLGRLGITVKVITGDSAEVATKVCRDLGMTVTGALTGEQADAMSDDELAPRHRRHHRVRTHRPRHEGAHRPRRSAIAAPTSPSWATA